jgi:predicted nucleic acid-binding protein
MAIPRPDRPVGVLDACVLIPAGLRDVLLSCAHESAFRPVWQDEILDEVLRNSVRLLRDRSGVPEEAATAAAAYTLEQMARAFPDACRPSETWVPLVPGLSCDEKDRHVLAVALGAEATHLVTNNARDFPPASVPRGLAVIPPDRFLLELLAAVPDQVVDAVEGMSNRLKQPRKTSAELAEQMAKGRHLPEFGDKLGRILAEGLD